MMHTSHLSEDELIAFHLHEVTSEAAIRQHLEGCRDCAALSASIAETLRVFSAEPVPQPNLEHHWQRLRGNLSVLSPVPSLVQKRVFRLLLWPATGLAIAVVLLLVFGIDTRLRSRSRPELAAHKPAHFTATPTDPAVANHIDRAERLLTEVSHTPGPLDPATRAQAHDLLLSNAVYVQTAHKQGDLGQASVLEDLGRVLTNIDHEATTPLGGLRVRVEMHTDGLLLELRILRQNDLRQ